MVDLLEKVKYFIEEENYNALEAIYNAELAKLGKCAVISKKILLAQGLSASSDIPKNDACLRVMSLSCKLHFNISFSTLNYILLLLRRA